MLELKKIMKAIEVRNLKKVYRVFEKEAGIAGTVKSLFARKYKEVKAIDKISFSIKEGELVGFIGPNGAGKTTTLKCLSGLLYPTSGEISVLGYKPWKRNENFLKSIAFVMGQKNQLWWELPPVETFILNKEIYDIKNDEYKKTTNHLIDLLDAKEIINVPVKKLSLGQRMKCELISALIHSPKVLFLDEPTIGLDVVMQNNLREFIHDYNKKFKATVLLTSHYMGDVQALTKRVIIINQGKIIFDGHLSKLVKNYAPYKLVSLILKNDVSMQELENLGEVKFKDFPRVTLRISSRNSAQTAANILSRLPVGDLNIEDADIEDVIRDVFESKHET